jgi:hypothetical protein
VNQDVNTNAVISYWARVTLFRNRVCAICVFSILNFITLKLFLHVFIF